MALTHPDRLFPTDPATRDLTRTLYQEIRDLPIISPHGHCDPRWFAENQRFPNPADLFITPDHYVFRMLASQGIALDDLGIARADGSVSETDPHKIWQLFAENYYLFRGTPSSGWLDHAFEHVFGLEEPLTGANAADYYIHIDQQLATDAFRPRALFERFNIEVLATTEGALDDLRWHQAIRDSGWSGRVITTYRPDTVIDPEFEGFHTNIEILGELTDENTLSWSGYLRAHRQRRECFKSHGATASDHGHFTARTASLSTHEAEKLFQKALRGECSTDEADLFRGQMLTEMARMSLDDGLVMQIHPGSYRNHSAATLTKFGRDKGFDIPVQTSYVQALKPLLDTIGMEPELSIILFTLDETAYGRELAPLAGAYPSLKLGPAWWFFDSPDGMRRFREATTETCGFYNTVGFNDDTRAFCSIPARHDVARRVDCAYLANLVMSGRLRAAEAVEVAHELAYALAKRAYRLAD